jgi:hypothetical protein
MACVSDAAIFKLLRFNKYKLIMPVKNKSGILQREKR